MAFHLPHSSPSGAYAEYWKITQVTINYLEGGGWVTISGYFNSEKRAANLPPVMIKDMSISMPTPGEDPRGSIYEHLKTVQPFFADAVDV